MHIVVKTLGIIGTDVDPVDIQALDNVKQGLAAGQRLANRRVDEPFERGNPIRLLPPQGGQDPFISIHDFTLYSL
jgi:hypothetical protein